MKRQSTEGEEAISREIELASEDEPKTDGRDESEEDA